MSITALLIYLCFTLINTVAYAQTPLPQDQSSAVILAYHRIGEDAHPDTSLSFDLFMDHVKQIQNGTYKVLPLPDIITAFKNNQPLPERTLAITFEGAHRSAYQLAMPILLKQNIPFTVLYAANKADQDLNNYMNWQELKTLSKNPLVTLGTLPSPYDHLADQDETTITTALNIARQKHRAHFSAETDILSYPFGGTSPLFRRLAKQQGFKAALTLNSGAAHNSSDLNALPRFTITDGFGDLQRFHMIAQSLPLPVSEFEPASELLAGDQPFTAGFTLPEALTDTPDCYLSGTGKADIQRIDQRIEIRASERDTHDQRFRLNCTMAGPQNAAGDIQWRWYGKLFLRPALQPDDTGFTQNPPAQDVPQ